MQIARSLDQRLTDRPTVLTIGKFDGVHVGHRQLIITAVERARQLNCASAVLTFDPHPDLVIRPDRELHLLTTLEERSALIGALAPDILVVAPFTRATMATPAADYMRQVCAALPVGELWVGAGFALGHGREGDIPRLTEIGHELGYTMDTVAQFVVDGAPVSASRVRQLLREGDVAGVVPLLGRAFSLRGTVVAGDQRGHTIGFPTANLSVDRVHILPADGVYACRAYLDEAATVVRSEEPAGADSVPGLPAVANIGVRPTFGALDRTIEAHLLDWSGDLYGRSLRLTFLHRLRGEQQFTKVADLIAQINRDAQQARAWLGYGA